MVVNMKYNIGTSEGEYEPGSNDSVLRNKLGIQIADEMDEAEGTFLVIFMDVQATQAGFGPLDYTLFDTHRDFYIKSIQGGVAGEYQHLEKLISDSIIEIS
jgi:hypothetical protein